MPSYCQHCGAALGESARFCQECGRAVRMEPLPDTSSVGPVEDAAPPSASFAARNRVALVAGVLVLGLAVVGGLWLGRQTTGPTFEAETPVPEATSAAQAPESVDYHVAVDTDLRDAPRDEGSQIVGRIERGQPVRGVIVDGARGKRWLKLDEGGTFVNLASLSSSAPPRLVDVDGSDRITTASCSVRETEAAGSKEKVVLASGSPVRVAGTTGKGVVELVLPEGGVGYVAADACPTKPSSAKGAVANHLIQFDPRSCELGEELAPYFEKASEVRPDPESEEEFIFPVDKTFRGLRVNYIVLGYEWQGVTFAESPARVQAVFRQLGFPLDKGGFVVPDDIPVSASITATGEDKQNRGKSELICGI